MVYGNSKRIVVVRDIPSNVIEEAILILKQEPGNIDNENMIGKKQNKETVKVNTDYLLKEAETIINSYINEHKLEKVYHKKVFLGKKFIIKDRKKIQNIILNTTLVCSIALLIFVISRLLQ